MFELCIVWILFERRYWDSIVQLLAKRVNRVVNYYNVAERHVPEDAEVLDVDVVRSLDALVPIKAVLNKLTRWVDVVQNGIGIAWVRSSKHANFEVLIRKLEDLFSVRTDVEACG